MNFSYFTDMGRVRPDNQDSFRVEVLDLARGQALLAVADGMGGHASGDVASRLAVDTLCAQVRLQAATWGDGAARLDGLRQAALAAHDGLLAAQTRDPGLAGMGTTLTAALCWGERISLVHAGDSRCYLLRGGQIRQLTEDHSVVGEMIRQGSLSEAEAMVHPRRNILTSALGSQPTLRLDLFEVEWAEGDLCLLCTDGLSNLIASHEVAAAAADPDHWESLAERLVAMANERGGTDNITVLAAWRVRCSQ